MIERSSKCFSFIGIIIPCPHLLHGTVLSGAKSPGMNTFVSQASQVTIFSGFSPV